MKHLKHVSLWIKSTTSSLQRIWASLSWQFRRDSVWDQNSGVERGGVQPTYICVIYMLEKKIVFKYPNFILFPFQSMAIENSMQSSKCKSLANNADWFKFTAFVEAGLSKYPWSVNYRLCTKHFGRQIQRWFSFRQGSSALPASALIHAACSK